MNYYACHEKIFEFPNHDDLLTNFIIFHFSAPLAVLAQVQQVMSQR